VDSASLTGRQRRVECGESVMLMILGLLINLNGSGHYIHWGFIQISVANFVVIVLMIVVFVLAILLPFPRRKEPHK
jgi:hypothetical protein